MKRFRAYYELGPVKKSYLLDNNVTILGNIIEIELDSHLVVCLHFALLSGRLVGERHQAKILVWTGGVI